MRIVSLLEFKVLALVYMHFFKMASLARGRPAPNPQTQEPIFKTRAGFCGVVHLTISALVWHSHEFVDRGVYLEFVEKHVTGHNVTTLLTSLNDPAG